VRFVWFWTFWHWSREGFRAGSLLRGPLHGIAGHWDEWYRHEASPEDRRAVEDAGRSKAAQRAFVGWLARHWAREAEWRGSRPPARFVLGQLAHVAPFDRWPALEKYRASYGPAGVWAIVLAEGSAGESADVRRVEALVVPADADAAAPAVVAEGFEADDAALDAARRAALGMLGGTGLLAFLALWVAGGRRPYPRWLGALLALGWAAAAALAGWLLVGPDPGERLLPLVAALAALWAALVMTATGAAAAVVGGAWRLGARWRRRLEADQLRLRMSGGLRLIGGSAGVPFSLNALLAVYRANPAAASASWLWERFFRRMRAGAPGWAATGSVAADGRISPVVLESKLRACLRHEDISDVLTPWQRGARGRVIRQLADGLKETHGGRTAAALRVGGARLGFAAELPRLRGHRCRHLAQAMMSIGGLTSVPQVAVNVLALAVSAVMLAALPDLRGILRPPPAPAAVAPSSPSPYHLWVSLDTKHPEDFEVLLESRFWSNRRATVAAYGGDNASVRAELRLNRLDFQTVSDEEDGTVWIERRRRFLTRAFAPGERVGRYTLSYLTRLGHD